MFVLSLAKCVVSHPTPNFVDHRRVHVHSSPAQCEGLLVSAAVARIRDWVLSDRPAAARGSPYTLDGGAAPFAGFRDRLPTPSHGAGRALHSPPSASLSQLHGRPGSAGARGGDDIAPSKAAVVTAAAMVAAAAASSRRRLSVSSSAPYSDGALASPTPAWGGAHSGSFNASNAAAGVNAPGQTDEGATDRGQRT